MMTLYDFMGSGNGYKVRLVLAHLGLPYKLAERDILKGETRTPAFLTKNPNGRIPTLQLEDGTHLFESDAIVWFLAEGTALAPQSRLARARRSAGASLVPSARYQAMAFDSKRWLPSSSCRVGMRPLGFLVRNSGVRVSPFRMSRSTSL